LIHARRLVAMRCLYGVDKDPVAVAMTRLSLWLLARAEGDPLTLLDHAVRRGDSLLGAHDRRQLGRDFDSEQLADREPFHWPLALPEVFARGGFDAVIGNPPWGQKGIDADAVTRRFVRRHYPSARGIFDLFRPFVERAVRITRPGGAVGLVLPDVLL